TIKVGDKITTDHIIPAGSRMKYRSNVPKYSEFLFELLDPEFFNRAKVVRDSGKHNLIVAGESYGQGSSREHAALCPMHMGVKAVLARSFERIHTANLINFGIITITFRDNADYDKIDQGDMLEIPDIRQRVSQGRELIVRNKTRGIDFNVDYNLSKRARDILLAGGALSYVKNKRNV
ncbi:MAG: aconitate hydratase, partial [Thermodesulfobacteriota bacterium]|nr:aconitate hydratase [Thermodesulfobacteriota bacterium]